METSISVFIFSDDSEKIAKAAETLARTCVGLALDGIDVNIRFGELGDLDDED